MAHSLGLAGALVLYDVNWRRCWEDDLGQMGYTVAAAAGNVEVDTDPKPDEAEDGVKVPGIQWEHRTRADMRSEGIRMVVGSPGCMPAVAGVEEVGADDRIDLVLG